VSALLEIHRLEVAYGPSQVLFGLDLAMNEGQAATLLGRNGMGKTTMLRTICGLQPVKGGSIRFAGERIDGWRPDRIGRAGIALVPEGRQCFPNLTVDEHLVAFFANRRSIAEPWTPARVYELFPRLLERSKNLGNQLSGGEQQMLAIGRALVTNPRLLILDEATEGLAPLIRDEIWACLAHLRSQGQSVLVIDKYVEKLIALADHHTIIERGEVVWNGSSAELDADHGIWQRYLGI
jgi:branched-chain amino acid transport system ATP-binding protein